MVSLAGMTGLGGLGEHDDGQARTRSLPGMVLAPVRPSASFSAAASEASTEPFRTVEHRVERPLHPDRFRTALGAIARGCCFVRGTVWIAGMPDTRVAVQGVGPRVALANGGAWSIDARHGEWCRGTPACSMPAPSPMRKSDPCHPRVLPAPLTRPDHHHHRQQSLKEHDESTQFPPSVEESPGSPDRPTSRQDLRHQQEEPAHESPAGLTPWNRGRHRMGRRRRGAQTGAASSRPASS